ncbi:MAG: phage tail protein [Chloroflexota bacterium]
MEMLGEIKLFSGNYLPQGWRYCDGSEMKTWDHFELYKVVAPLQGENFWNDTFYLPDLREEEHNLDRCRYIIRIEGQAPAQSS